MNAKGVIVALVLAAGVAGLGGCSSATGRAEVNAQSAPPEPDMAGRLDQAAGWTHAAFNDLGITVSEDELEHDGQRREIEGTNSNGDKVDVSIEPQASGGTILRVTAKHNTQENNQALATQVLNQILSKR